MWLNLMYACPECQTRKGNKWPGTLKAQDEQAIDRGLSQLATSDGWSYLPVSVDVGYVNPNGIDDPAEGYFEYDEVEYRIAPSRDLPDDRRSKALRTIFDIGLDEESLSQERRNHIDVIKQYLESKGTRRRTEEIGALVSRHRRRKLKDTKPSAYGPSVRFTGLVLFAHQHGWLETANNRNMP
ncbi:MAG: hypothetical protein OXF79_20840 [Chloroflexi bacterium]|nr:hypothetical protein [Chloroflexota bacterium]